MIASKQSFFKIQTHYSKLRNSLNQFPKHLMVRSISFKYTLTKKNYKNNNFFDKLFFYIRTTKVSRRVTKKKKKTEKLIRLPEFSTIRIVFTSLLKQREQNCFENVMRIEIGN